MTAEPLSQSDDEIIRRVIDGDVNAFEYLLKKYQNHVFKIAGNHIPPAHVEETAQETFIRAYKALPTFRQKGRFRPWLSTIAVRACQDFWRKQYRSREKAVSDLTEAQQDWLDRILSDQSSQSFNESWNRREAREVLDWALDQLSPEDRIIIELVHLENHTIKEAAELMGLSAANIKVRAFRSRRKLQNLLSEAGWATTKRRAS